MVYKQFSSTDIARLLADKVTTDFNFKEQLWFIARANDREPTEYLCLLLRTQLDFQLLQEGQSFFHDCFHGWDFTSHIPFHDIVCPVSFQV